MNIDSTVIIACPVVGFALRSATYCIKCEFYKGMTKAEVETDNIDDYHIICGRPITRRMIQVIT